MFIPPSASIPPLAFFISQQKDKTVKKRINALRSTPLSVPHVKNSVTLSSIPGGKHSIPQIYEQTLAILIKHTYGRPYR
jgi:ABC-type sulfate transport system permease component